MPDRYSYSSPWAGGNQPWFRLGQIDVTTTVAVIGLGIISMLIWAIEGTERTVSNWLILVSEEAPGVGSVLEGQIWRLVTWPLMNEPDIWTIILLAVFFMFGNQLENLMGRKTFLWFLLALTIIPALVVTILDLVASGFLGAALGLRYVELGVLIAFVAQYPNVRFWPGIPGWILGSIIVGLDLLQAIGNRDDFALVMLLCIIVLSLVGMRSLGYAEELQWVPAVRLPGAVTGTGRPSRSSSSGGGRSGRTRGRGKSRANLSAVPPLRNEPTDDLADMEIDALLDQVAEKGLASLTKEQRKRLEEHSKRLRKRREG